MVEIRSFNPHTDGEAYVDGVIACYQRSFAGPPWEESHKCASCKQSFGAAAVAAQAPSLACPESGCEATLEEYWPYDQVRTDFFNETNNNPDEDRQASSWIASVDDVVVGICWGYTIQLCPSGSIFQNSFNPVSVSPNFIYNFLLKSSFLCLYVKKG